MNAHPVSAPAVPGSVAPASLDGKVAIVTGAGSGIGRVTAHCLGRCGALVIATDVREDSAQETASQLISQGHEALAVACDLGVRDEVEYLVQRGIQKFGGIDLLDHNAAWASQRRDTDATSIELEAWDKTLRVNTRGGLLLAREVIPHMVARGRGAIVNISSGSASIGTSSRLAYGVSKAALNQLTRHLAARYGPQGIRANAVAPGFILTEAAASAITEDLRRLLISRTPSARLGTPEDIAHVVAFLLSDRSSFINGQVINVDGGLSIAGTLPIGGP